MAKLSFHTFSFKCRLSKRCLRFSDHTPLQHVMFIPGSKFSRTENEIQALNPLTAVLCVQISYLSDRNVTIPRTIQDFSYFISGDIHLFGHSV